MIIYTAVTNYSIQVIGIRTFLISLAAISAVVSAVGVAILCADFERGQENVGISDRIGKPAYIFFKFFSVSLLFTIVDYLLFSVPIKTIGFQSLILFFFILVILPPLFFFRAGKLRLENFE